MFLRFSKGKFRHNNDQLSTIRKCVLLGDTVVMEYGEKIVGVAKLHEETDNYLDYDVIVANQCELGGKAIARYIKDMIGKSNKFTAKPTKKKRKYFVEEIDADVLPIKPQIQFTQI